MEKKRKAYKRTLQSNVLEHVKEMRMREYKECKKQVERIVRENWRTFCCSYPLGERSFR